jgi:Zn-dependent M28 family amino/carboxypeptidase
MALAGLAASMLTACSPQAEAPAPEAQKTTLPDPVPLPKGETPTDIIAEDSPALVISEDALARRIAEMADDKYEGRAPTTPGGIAASQWVADEMARIGLKGAVDGKYFERVPLVEATLDEAASSFNFSVNGETLPFSYGTDSMYWTKKTDAALNFSNSDVVFVGYGIVAPEYGWNDYAGVDVKGKTVVMLVNDPGYATRDPDLFNGKAMTYYGRWTYKFEEAGRQGAVAAIIVHETEPASYPWEVVSGSWSGPQYDLERPDGGANRTKLEGWITDDAAKKLFLASGLDFQALKDSAAKKGFKPVAMAGVTASGTLKTQVKHLVSRNVAGVLPGAKNPDEYVLYMAHWDHLGKKDMPDGQDGIYNGAVDNATGVAAILGIADVFVHQETPPDRSILFLAVTAEESGLLGSAYFAEAPFVPLKNIVGGINIDALLPMGRTKDMEIVGFGASELEDILKQKAAQYGKHLVPDQSPEAGHFYRSDHISLAKKGVPMIYGAGGGDLRDGGVEAGEAFASGYTKDRYHKPADEYSADWNLSGMVEDVSILYEVGEAMSHEGVWPNWYKGNEFRALRDKMREE